MASAGMPEVRGYRDLVRIGRGGFSFVYRAEQISLGRAVAIKILLTDLADDAEVRRFTNECQILGRLGTHRHVVDVYDAGVTDDGRPYIVMKFYARGSLSDRFRAEGALAPSEVTSIGIKMAEALEAAHSIGVIHRDVKPDNVLIDDDGEPVLTDFGVAAIADAAGRYTSSVAFSHAHVAPEVLDRNEFGVPSDLYSLGSTLYTLLTGRAAFAADTEARQIIAIMQSPPPPIDEPHVPAALKDVITKAMAKDPSDRFATAAEFRLALEGVDDPAGSKVAPPTSPRGLSAAPVALAGLKGGVDEATSRSTSPTPPPHVAPDDDTDATRRRPAATGGSPEAGSAPTAASKTSSEDSPPVRTVVAARSSRRAWLIPGAALTALVVLFVVVAAALGSRGNGDEKTAPPPAAQPSAAAAPAKASPKSSQAPKPTPTPTPTPSTYQEILSRPGFPIVTYEKCRDYDDLFTRYAATARKRLSSGKGVAKDEYVAASYRSSHPWVKEPLMATFQTSLVETTTNALNEVGGGRASEIGYLLPYLQDAMKACGLVQSKDQVETAVSRADAMATSIVTAANKKPWYPKGFAEISRGYAYRYIDNARPNCSQECHYWTFDVVVKETCRGNVTGTLIRLNKSEQKLGTLSASLPSLRKGASGRMYFIQYGAGSAAANQYGQIQKIICRK